MSRIKNEFLTMFIVVTFAASTIFFGCSSMKPSAPMSAEQTDLVKQQFGTIGVVSARYMPRVELQIPAKGPVQGAGKGALQLPASFIESSARMGNPYMVVLSILAAPVLAVAGGVNGAIAAEPKEVVEKKEAALKKSLEEIKVQETMRGGFLKKTVELKEYVFLDQGSEGPRSEGDHPDYQLFAGQGIKTIHELTVRDLSLNGEHGIDPDLSLVMRVQARLVSTADNSTLFVRAFTCESPKYKFSYWTLHDARRFQEELNRCYADIADNMATKLFIFDTTLRERAGREQPSTHRPR